MQLKPFEAGRYDDHSIVIRNPANGKQELFSESQFEIVKFLKQNEQESLLALLLPNIGIAKKDHILACLRVLTKLKRMQIVDNFAITGRRAASDTATIEIESESDGLRLPAIDSLLTVIFTLGERLFSWLGAYGILFLCFAAAVFGWWKFSGEKKRVADLAVAAKQKTEADDHVALLEAEKLFSQIDESGQKQLSDDGIVVSMAEIEAQLYQAYGVAEAKPKAEKLVGIAKDRDLKKAERYAAEAF